MNTFGEISQKKEVLVNVDDEATKKDPLTSCDVDIKSEKYVQAWNGQREYLLRILAHNMSEALLPEQSTAILDLIREISKIEVKAYPKESTKQTNALSFGLTTSNKCHVFGSFGTQTDLQQEAQNLKNTIEQQKQHIRELENKLITNYGISKKRVDPMFG